MTPLTAKILIILALVIIFLIAIVLMYLIYINLIRPWKIELLQYRKVLTVAQYIMQSEDKVNDLIDADIKDIDLIKTAEQEIKKAKLKAKQQGDILSELIKKIKWRKKEDGKEKPVQTTTRGKDKGEARTEETTRQTTDPGERDSKTRFPKSDNGAAEYGTIQSESARTDEKQYRYFS